MVGVCRWDGCDCSKFIGSWDPNVCALCRHPHEPPQRRTSIPDPRSVPPQPRGMGPRTVSQPGSRFMQPSFPPRNPVRMNPIVTRPSHTSPPTPTPTNAPTPRTVPPNVPPPAQKKNTTKINTKDPQVLKVFNELDVTLKKTRGKGLTKREAEKLIKGGLFQMVDGQVQVNFNVTRGLSASSEKAKIQPLKVPTSTKPSIPTINRTHGNQNVVPLTAAKPKPQIRKTDTEVLRDALRQEKEARHSLENEIKTLRESLEKQKAAYRALQAEKSTSRPTSPREVPILTSQIQRKTEPSENKPSKPSTTSADVEKLQAQFQYKLNALQKNVEQERKERQCVERELEKTNAELNKLRLEPKIHIAASPHEITTSLPCHNEKEEMSDLKKQLSEIEGAREEIATHLLEVQLNFAQCIDDYERRIIRERRNSIASTAAVQELFSFAKFLRVVLEPLETRTAVLHVKKDAKLIAKITACTENIRCSVEGLVRLLYDQQQASQTSHKTSQDILDAMAMHLTVNEPNRREKKKEAPAPVSLITLPSPPSITPAPVSSPPTDFFATSTPNVIVDNSEKYKALSEVSSSAFGDFLPVPSQPPPPPPIQEEENPRLPIYIPPAPQNTSLPPQPLTTPPSKTIPPPSTIPSALVHSSQPEVPPKENVASPPPSMAPPPPPPSVAPPTSVAPPPPPGVAPPPIFTVPKVSGDAAPGRTNLFAAIQNMDKRKLTPPASVPKEVSGEGRVDLMSQIRSGSSLLRPMTARADIPAPEEEADPHNLLQILAKVLSVRREDIDSDEDDWEGEDESWDA